MVSYGHNLILNGQHLKIGANYPSDCEAFSTNIENPVDFSQLNTGIDYYMIKFLANHFNYTYEVIHGHFKYGTVANGTIDGICGMANRSVSKVFQKYTKS